MSFVRCLSCDWMQDDFYNLNGYTPLRQDIIDWLRPKLFSPIEVWVNEQNGEDEVVTGSEFVARELEKMVKSIRGMAVITEKEFLERVKDNLWRCPSCGSKKWTID